jgi:hypothetical protein
VSLYITTAGAAAEFANHQLSSVSRTDDICNISTNAKCLYLTDIILTVLLVKFCVILPIKQAFSNSYYAIMEDQLEERGTCPSNDQMNDE